MACSHVSNKCEKKNLDRPFVLKKYMQKFNQNNLWNCLTWDIKKWMNIFGNYLMKIRIGPKDGSINEPIWEEKCLTDHWTFKTLWEWSNGNLKMDTCNLDISSTHYWAYYDYVYMKNLPFLESLKGDISWDMFGFNGRGTDDSTIWIGTEGSNTPCHIDTYGYNIVVQVYGKKRWVLIAPSESEFMYPSRIPFEESSIYSKVSFPFPNIATYPDIANINPHVIVLEPGDVLFVPNKWWHFVENLTFSISINTWVKLPSDNNEQMKEALALYQVCCICHGIESTEFLKKIINPNMLDLLFLSSSDLLNLLFRKIIENYVPDSLVENYFKYPFLKDISLCNSINNIEQISFQKYFSSYCINSNEVLKHSVPSLLNDEKEFSKILLDVLTDQRVLNTICSVLKEKFNLNK